MENPIQYHNTDNPSQRGVSHNKGGGLSQEPIVIISPQGLIITGKPLWYAPRGLMKTLHRHILKVPQESHVCLVSVKHITKMNPEKPTFCPRSKVASHRDSIRNGKIPHINNNTPTLINYAAW